MNNPDKRLSARELTQSLASFDYAHNDVLPAELLQATMNGEAPHVEYNSITSRSLPGVTSSMTLDDERVDAISGEIGTYLKALVASLPRKAGYAPYNIPCLQIHKTRERIYYHPLTGEKIRVGEVSHQAMSDQTTEFHDAATRILDDAEQ